MTLSKSSRRISISVTIPAIFTILCVVIAQSNSHLLYVEGLQTETETGSETQLQAQAAVATPWWNDYYAAHTTGAVGHHMLVPHIPLAGAGTRPGPGGLPPLSTTGLAGIEDDSIDLADNGASVLDNVADGVEPLDSGDFGFGELQQDQQQLHDKSMQVVAQKAKIAREEAEIQKAQEKIEEDKKTLAENQTKVKEWTDEMVTSLKKYQDSLVKHVNGEDESDAEGDDKAKDGKAKDGKAKDGKAKDGKAKDGKAEDGDGKTEADKEKFRSVHSSGDRLDNDMVDAASIVDTGAAMPNFKRMFQKLKHIQQRQ
jgi:ElaB/YqjD/DUF883 family membrane-anchored ribosome-binding protein